MTIQVYFDAAHLRNRGVAFGARYGKAVLIFEGRCRWPTRIGPELSLGSRLRIARLDAFEYAMDHAELNVRQYHKSNPFIDVIFYSHHGDLVDMLKGKKPTKDADIRMKVQSLMLRFRQNARWKLKHREQNGRTIEVNELAMRAADPYPFESDDSD